MKSGIKLLAFLLPSLLSAGPEDKFTTYPLNIGPGLHLCFVTSQDQPYRQDHYIYDVSTKEIPRRFLSLKGSQCWVKMRISRETILIENGLKLAFLHLPTGKLTWVMPENDVIFYGASGNTIMFKAPFPGFYPDKNDKLGRLYAFTYGVDKTPRQILNETIDAFSPVAQLDDTLFVISSEAKRNLWSVSFSHNQPNPVKICELEAKWGDWSIGAEFSKDQRYLALGGIERDTLNEGTWDLVIIDLVEGRISHKINQLGCLPGFGMVWHPGFFWIDQKTVAYTDISRDSEPGTFDSNELNVETGKRKARSLTVESGDTDQASPFRIDWQKGDLYFRGKSKPFGNKSVNISRSEDEKWLSYLGDAAPKHLFVADGETKTLTKIWKGSVYESNLKWLSPVETD